LNYEIYIEKAALKSPSKIPTKDQNRVVESIQSLLTIQGQIMPGRYLVGMVGELE